MTQYIYIGLVPHNCLMNNVAIFNKIVIKEAFTFQAPHRDFKYCTIDLKENLRSNYKVTYPSITKPSRINRPMKRYTRPIINSIQYTIIIII